jgi:PAS domain S-box-containing protein
VSIDVLLRGILDAQTEESIWLFDGDGNVLFANATALGSVGRTEEEIFGRCAEIFLPPELHLPRLEAIRQVMESGQPLQLDEEQYGHTPIRHLLRPVPDAKGRITSVAFFSREISANDRIVGQLRRSEERLRIAKDAASLGIYDHDLRTGLLDWDSRLRELFGIGAGTVTYENFMDRLHPDDREGTRAAVDRAFDPAGDGRYSSEFRVKGEQDGTVTWVAATGQVFFEAGTAVRIVGTGQDITSRREVEEQLRERECSCSGLARSLARQAAELETVLDSIEGAVYVFDASGRPSRTNAASRSLYGFDVVKLGDRTCAAARLQVRHLDGTTMKPEEYPSARALSGESTTGVLYLFTAADGKERVAEASAHPLRVDGSIAGAVVVVHDVTERVRAGEQLLHSRELYRAITANLPNGGVLVVDRELRYLVADGPLWARMGSRGEAMVGRTVSETLPPYLAQVAERRYRRALAGETDSYESNYSDMLVWSNYQPLRDARGEVVAVIALCFDITARRRVEEELRLAAARYEQQIRLFDGFASTTPDLMFLFDRQGRFLYANRRLLRLLGIELPDIVGKSFSDLGYPKSQHDLHMGEIAEVIGKKLPVRGEIPFEAPITRIFGIYEYVFTPVLGPDGEVELVAGTGRDVTERKRTEVQLRQHAVRFERIAHAIPDVLYVTDMGTLETTYVNGSVAQLIGYTPQEVTAMGSELFTLLHPDDKAIASFKMAALEEFPDGEVVETEFRMRHKDGYYRWLRARDVAFTRDADGKLRQFLGIGRDITEQKEAETALRLSEEALRKAHDELELRVEERTAELQSALEELHEKEHLLIMQSRQAAMGEMIGNIAHQWRQPLNTLALVVQKLGLFNQSGECSRELIEETVSRSMQLIQHMSRTIDDFRNFFIPHKEKVTFRVRDAVSDALKLMEGSLNSGGIAVRVEQEDDPSVYGYPSEYAQVLLNILTNAKDAFDTRQTPLPQVVIAVGSSESRSLVTVRDNAGGIPEDVLPKVFDPHFTTKGPSGTGIGLFMSRVIVEKNMNGRLGVCNVADGALFSIEV